ILLIGILYFIYSILSKIFIKNITKSLRSKVFKGILNHNYKDFTGVNSADYISALTNDIKLVEENYILPLLSILQYTVMFIVTIGVLLYLSPTVTLVLFISMIVLFIVPSIFGKALESRQLEVSNKLTSFTSKLKDILLGYDVIKSYNLKNEIIDEFDNENHTLATTKLNADKLFVVNESLSQILGLSSQIVALFFSAYLVIKGNLSMGMLIAIVQLSGTFVQPVIMIMTEFPKITSMKPIIERLNKLSDYKDESFEGKENPTFDKVLEVKNLSFSYNENRNVINNLNLKLDKNKKYAIVGNSGCGKSTLVKLLLGYYADYEGEINYDNKSMKNLQIEKINRMISIIHQNVYMFDKNIKDNICLYKGFSDKKLKEALSLSGSNTFIDDLDDGIEYAVGENGSNLSGGQKQRIAIARALIQETPILVLDEGTSAIDMQTGYDIESRLLDIDDLTLITITHKMSEELLGLYDEIIFMENGNIVEKGSLDELLEKESKFFDFYTLETT
ncbi:MAG: ABC transporter ATP-binding protein, partial [Romboutsia sp.]|uniref:ABC transporter ATP-binding protein n=1 Tax=Romboutsia sp. TaxID=1965302 RepID=UPI003F357A05